MAIGNLLPCSTPAHDEVIGIDPTTGFQVTVDGAFHGVPTATHIMKSLRVIDIATALYRLLRSRPSDSTRSAWSPNLQRLFDVGTTDLRELRGFIHHDTTRQLRDAIDLARTERSARIAGRGLPTRNNALLATLRHEIDLAKRDIAGLTAQL
ncbi:hypothetical protein [Rhodococcus sp. NPDC060176]|uniref:hypothetical protein n=1 Tax=Rhodococcus sp. NPDC060176 TaxID=3347062 RepID=UPI0036471E02